VAGEDAEPFAAGMGVPEQRVWAWKDELPRRGLARYGRFFAGRASFLSPALLAALYPGAGEVDDHEALPLSAIDHDLARILAREALPSAELRAAVGDRARYERAAVELQRRLLVTIQECGRTGLAGRRRSSTSLAGASRLVVAATLTPLRASSSTPCCRRRRPMWPAASAGRWQRHVTGSRGWSCQVRRPVAAANSRRLTQSATDHTLGNRHRGS
jgi:hypothetical protein